MADQEVGQAIVEIHAYPGRQLPARYLNLVQSRWKRSYKLYNDYMKLADAQAYYQAYGVYVLSILQRPTTIVRLAVLREDNDVALGFSVMEKNLLHYVEVPRSYRRQGIATHLVPGEIKWFTHLTKIGLKLWGRKFPDAKFNPFA